jgi:hypothetical protein
LSFSKVDALLSHLTWCHAILSSGQEVSCGQEGCPRKFTCFKSLRQYLSRHTNEMVESDNSGPAVFSSAECFSSTESFIRLLKRNPKTSGLDFSNRNLSVDERKKVVAVGTSKLMETDSAYPSRAAKLRLAQLLSEVSGLPSVVFFDPVSHRGYIAKKLENLRTKLSPSKRLFSWKKRKTVCEEESAGVTNAVICENSVEGCPRGMSGCSLCRGV